MAFTLFTQHPQLICCAHPKPAQASDIVKKGKMCSLFINDLDAGAGRMGEGTQYTVNNQMVSANMTCVSSICECEQLCA